MTPTRRHLAAFLAAALLAGACGGDPTPSTAPSGVTGSAAPSVAPASTDLPFRAAAWPADGSTCDLPGYAGLLGRIEAVAARTVRFTLCSPDGAFLSRLAHPALGIVNAATVDEVAADAGAGRAAQGAGDFRIEAWTPGDNVRLERTRGAAGSEETPAPSASGGKSAPPSTIVLRWVASDADRSALLRDASVDGVSALAPADAAEMDTLPELTVLDRPALATAYLGFGTGFTPGVRRAFAQALDHAALAEALGPGVVAATHLAPCEVPGGCSGKVWYASNGPAATALLTEARFNRKARLVLHIPDIPVPGLSDPAALAAAVRDQLTESVGLTVTLDTMPATEMAAAIAGGDLDGLYLWGVASTLADPSGFLEPLFGRGASGSAAARAKAVKAALVDAARSSGAGARTSAFAKANNAVRAAAPVVPLVHPGSAAGYRSDVAGAGVSPVGVDPLASFVPADRHQLVVAEAAEPAGAWCAVDVGPASPALCALVTPGLYRFDGASLVPVPDLASECTASDDARVWTCRLRGSLRTGAGLRIDAGDVLASIRAVADAGSPLRAAYPPGAFAAYDALFGGAVPAGTP